MISIKSMSKLRVNSRQDSHKLEILSVCRNTEFIPSSRTTEFIPCTQSSIAKISI